ncbi:MAG: glycosyltransferase [Oscillospiraceae bacterium]
MQLDVLLYSTAGDKAFGPCLAALRAAGEGVTFGRVALVGTAGQGAAAAGFADVHHYAAKPGREARGLARAAAAAGAPWLLVMDAGFQVLADFFEAIEAGLTRWPAAGGFECRQLPWETQQLVDPVGLELPCLCGGAVLLRRAALPVGGLDGRLPLKAALQDLSFRMRAEDQRLYWLAGAVVTAPDAAEMGLEHYTQAALGRLLLSYKYRLPGGAAAARKQYRETLKRPRHFAGVRKALLRQYLLHWPRGLGLLFSRSATRAASLLAEKALAEPPRGLQPLAAPVPSGPRISVVIRTHKRTHQLRCALQSVANQTYTNIEVVVVEDGEADSQSMIEAEFPQLDVRYHATGQNVGRSRAGNIGLQMAGGEYLNLLDDDDLFYPDHLERVAAEAVAHPEADLITCNAMAMYVEAADKAPCGANVERYEAIHIDRLDLFMMAQRCQVHVSGVVFKKELYRQCGGFDEAMPAHEDWALWLRYFAVGRRIHPQQVDIARATTVYVLPASEAERNAKLAQYHRYDTAFFGDERLRFTVGLADMRRFYDGLIADMLHLRALGPEALDAYLEAQLHRNDAPED